MSEQFTVNLERVINSYGAWDLNKQLATKLSLQPNFAVGDFFKSLSDEDIDFLSAQANNSDTDEHAAAEMFLMTVLLCMAEGVDFGDDVAEVRFNIMIYFIAAESLHRKKLAILNHENMSFGDDMQHAELLRATPTGMSVIADVLKKEPDEN